MDSSHISEWLRQMGRINYHAGRLAAQHDTVCLAALRDTANLLEASADSYEGLNMRGPPQGYFPLPTTSPQSVPMQREVKSPRQNQGLGFTWAQNLTPRDEPDNPFSPRTRTR